MTSTRRRATPVVLVLFPLLLAQCTVNRSTVPPEEAVTLDHESPFLKVHMKGGGLYVLAEWTVDDAAKRVAGTGKRYDANRNVLGEGPFTIGVDSVALFETNVKRASGAMVALTVMTGVSLAVTIACVVNPKACFGSCPTFYVSGEDHETPRAEGFSSSIAPWLEATDVDALRLVAAAGERVDVVMRNEALETHVVRHVDLLAVPVTAGRRAMKDAGGAYWTVESIAPPASCRASEGDVLDRVRAVDGRERFGTADSTDLGAREEIDVVFRGAPAGDLGVVITARQTLLSTYLLYETLSYAGAETGAWLAKLAAYEPDNPIARAVGGIEVSVRDEGGFWRTVGEVGEVGPLATDAFLVRLPLGAESSGKVDVRLRLTRGAWRIDAVALASLGDEVEPRRLAPEAAIRDGSRDDAALAALWDPAEVLTTMPGDAYTLRYRLPDNGERYELFLESRGYYLEWIREEWLGREDADKVREMLLTTGVSLRRLAPEYKRLETTMEDAFWRSRYATP